MLQAADKIKRPLLLIHGELGAPTYKEGLTAYHAHQYQRLLPSEPLTGITSCPPAVTLQERTTTTVIIDCSPPEPYTDDTSVCLFAVTAGAEDNNPGTFTLQSERMYQVCALQPH
jgi:hypothetical protein